MKNILIYTLFLIGIGNFSYADLVQTDFKINQQRSAILLSISNPTGNDVFCSSVDVSISLVGDEFGESLGGFTLSDGPYYIPANEQIYLQDIGKSKVESYRSKDKVAIISNATVRVGECHQANFSEYCNYAEKTKEENYTIEKLKDAAKAERCEDVENHLKGNLRMGEQGISSLRPVSYLKSLKNVNLSKNNIENIEALKSLVLLKQIDLAYNPIKNIDALVILPNIERIKASNTLLEYKQWQDVSRTLKKIEVRGTPYEQIYKSKK